MTNDDFRISFVIGPWSFGFLLAFGIRHLAFSSLVDEGKTVSPGARFNAIVVLASSGAGSFAVIQSAVHRGLRPPHDTQRPCLRQSGGHSETVLPRDAGVAGHDAGDCDGGSRSVGRRGGRDCGVAGGEAAGARAGRSSPGAGGDFRTVAGYGGVERRAGGLAW